MKLSLTILGLFAIIATSGKLTEACIPIDLSCEYLINPIGIDSPLPRFRWKIEDARQGALQTAYEIVVGTNAEEVMQGIGNHWQSEKVTSNRMLVSYAGKALSPFTKYYWAVKVWDKNNKSSSFSKVASFETGMMAMQQWQGSWITDHRDIHLKAAPYFRKEFKAVKKIKSARAYVAAAGLFELYVNGERVGDHQLDPTYTRYDRRNLYVTHDITALLQEENAIGILLGNGWYNHQSTAVWFFDKAPWRARPKFCIDIRIIYEDGSTELILSDRDWKTSTGSLLFNSIYTAEHYDARLEQAGWNEVGFDDSKWQNAIFTSAPSNHIVAQALHPIRQVEEIPAVSMRKINDQQYIFDLGKNIAGITKINLQGEAGTVVRISHAELLDKTGDIDLSNIVVHYRPTDDSDPFQTDIYTLKGEGIETFAPKFNYKGFQYVKVESSQPIALSQESLIGIFMHSDVPAVGSIHSSSTLLNKLWLATNNAYLSNLFGYPTDCPQREKNGWTGDAHIAIETGLYNFDGITIYEKWLADHRDEQQSNGVLPSIIPSSDWGYAWGNGPDWTSTIAIIPWNIYTFYGDPKLLSDCYDNIKRYVDHITHRSPEHLTDWGLGDWVPVKSKTPKEFTSSIYYYVDVSILAKAAKLFGKEEDYQSYTQLAEKIKNAINQKYFNTQTSIYGSGFQTELSTALYWGIVPEAYVQRVAEQLAQKVVEDHSHIDVGLLGSKAILNALSEHGYADLAYTLASQEDFPSWGAWIKDGATTLFEDWKVDEERRGAMSRNHIMFGEISAWYYKALGGIIPDPQNPGFKNILLEPHFVKGLDHFNAKFNSPQGNIISAWERKDDLIHYRVSIPPNSTATLRLKAKNISTKESVQTQEGAVSTFQLRSGYYTFVIEK